jgi:hypothetical protein
LIVILVAAMADLATAAMPTTDIATLVVITPIGLAFRHHRTGSFHRDEVCIHQRSRTRAARSPTPTLSFSNNSNSNYGSGGSGNHCKASHDGYSNFGGRNGGFSDSGSFTNNGKQG